MAKVRIIHVSDLHLFVDADGNHRTLDERAITVRLMERVGNLCERLPSETVRKKSSELFGGLGTHSDAALRAMLNTLDRLLSDEGVANIVVQTGDVSTFGALGRGDAARFPEWEYWQGDTINALRGRATAWIDIFGNHDVWPGTLPCFAGPAIKGVVATFRARHVPDRLPWVRRVPLSDLVVELHALNSVLCTAGDNTFAVGELIPDVLGPKGVEPPDPLVDLNSNASAPGAIRVLMMHHPPHHFEKPGGGSERGLRDADRLGAWLEGRETGFQFQLVLAGHRHAIDPPQPADANYKQPPLPAHCLQLVCGTPTQESAAAPSFSVYELERTEKGIQVSRQIYSRGGLADRRFVPSDGGTFHVSC